MTWKDIKEVIKKFWKFLWYEDSLLSWMVNIVLAFIIIKFLIYPGLGLALGTQLPVVAVISESMEHEGNFDQWWASSAQCGEGGLLQTNFKACTQEQWYAEKNITKEDFMKFTLENGFKKGDIIILKGSNYDELKIGDILVFQSKMDYPIIHRIVYKDDTIQTKGDHNARQLETAQVNEKYITKEQIIGKAWFKVPWIGYIKIWFVDLLTCITFNGCSFN